MTITATMASPIVFSTRASAWAPERVEFRTGARFPARPPSVPSGAPEGAGLPPRITRLAATWPRWDLRLGDELGHHVPQPRFHRVEQLVVPEDVGTTSTSSNHPKPVATRARVRSTSKGTDRLTMFGVVPPTSARGSAR